MSGASTRKHSKTQDDAAVAHKTDSKQSPDRGVDRPPVHACCTGDARPTRGASNPSHSASSSPAGTAPPHATVTRAPRPAKRAGARLTLEGLRSAHRSPRWRPLAAHPAAPQHAQRTNEIPQTRRRHSQPARARGGARTGGGAAPKRRGARRGPPRQPLHAACRLAAPPATSAGHVGVLIASTRSHAAERRACGAESGARGLNASHALLLSVSRAPRVATREQQPARRRHSDLRPPAGHTHRSRRRSSGATWRADARRTFFSPSLTRVRSAPSRPPRAVKRRCGSLGVCLPAQGGRGGARVSSRSFELWQMKI